MRSKPAFSTLDQFTKAYVTAALWSSTDDKGEPLDKRYTWDNIRADSQQDIIADCAEFQKEHAEALDLIPGRHCTEDSLGRTRYSKAERAGHDYWLTRNGHGTGFWDREFSDQPLEVISCGTCGKRVFFIDSYSPTDIAICAECDTEVTKRIHAKSIPVDSGTLGDYLTQAAKLRGEVDIIESYNGTLCFHGRIKYLERPFVVREKLTWWQRAGKLQTATGYGSRLNSGYVLRIEGERIWRRVYAICWSNVASHYVMIRRRCFFVRMPDRSEIVS